MKKMKILFILVAIIATGCQPKVENQSVSLIDINETLTQLADRYMNAWNTKDMDALMALASEDGMFCGSDPSELMDKASMELMFKQVFSDTISDYRYTIDVRKIKLASDAKSAIVMEHISMPWSPKLKMRQTFQFVKCTDEWEINFLSWGFLANNEDVPILNKTLE